MSRLVVDAQNGQAPARGTAVQYARLKQAGRLVGARLLALHTR